MTPDEATYKITLNKIHYDNETSKIIDELTQDALAVIGKQTELKFSIDNTMYARGERLNYFDSVGFKVVDNLRELGYRASYYGCYRIWINLNPPNKFWEWVKSWF